MKAIAAALRTAEETRSRKAKVEALAGALAGASAGVLPFVARFLVGALLPAGDTRALGVGEALVLEAASAATGRSPAALAELLVKHGDAGSAVEEAAVPRPETLTIEAVEAMVETLAASRSRAEKLTAIRAVLEEASPGEARYIVRAVVGALRVGAKEGLVEEAIAKAFGREAGAVRRASGLVGDLGELARLAREDKLDEARVVLGRPVGFMLASPLDTARGADLRVPHAVEDKIDGIRAQAHVGCPDVRLFARGKGAVTAAFPELVSAFSGLPSAILDGEIVVVDASGRPRPFSALQRRLKKSAPGPRLLRDHPVRYLAYDLLHADGESLLALPFVERRARLAAWMRGARAPVILHPSSLLSVGDGDPTPALEMAFESARARGFEGLVLKRHDAPYAAGVRGFAWLKVKKALGTLDAVVVVADRGSGRRATWLSDYTFAVRDGARLVTIGKAYSGLTDAEMHALSARLEGMGTAAERGGSLPVRPEVVLEIAFDGLQRSARHTSGFALRFPRIARIRDDKRAEDADTLATVHALWEAQVASGHREEPPAERQLSLFGPSRRRDGVG